MRDLDLFKETLLTVVTDSDNKERILHVPVQAQAGYAAELTEPVLAEQHRLGRDLQTFMLPNLRHQQGSFRAFDVAGDSMQPSLYAGDVVVGAYLEADYWVNSLKQHLLCIFVLSNRIVVKRCAAGLKKGEKRLVLASDNPNYEPFVVEIADIREIWRVVSRITSETDLPPQDLNTLVTAIEAQTAAIQQFKNRL